MESLKENLTKEQRKALKRERKFKKEQSRSLKLGRLNTDDTNILCVRFGNKYGQDYVVKLRNMIERNITVPYKLYCLTDDPKPIEGVESIVIPNQGYAKGWWHKVHMFDPKLPITGRILYMDLDVVICGNIDKLTQIYNDDFMGIRDFNRKFHPNWRYLNSSVMSWKHGTQSHVFKKFKEAPQTAMRMHGDQDWIWKTSREIIKFWPELWIQSYKWEIRSREELHVLHGKRQFRNIRNDIKVDPECSIAVFHGDPCPDSVQDHFVAENWK